MYVCVCKGITDRQIENAVLEGANNLGKLRKSLGVASQCGKCSCQAREIISETLASETANGNFYAVA